MDDVSLRQLRALVCVGEQASFTAAAEQLGLSQPSVSHLIRRLEKELGLGLVARGQDVHLTAPGRHIAEVAGKAIRLIDTVLNEAREQVALQQGMVSVAVGHLTAATLLPAVLAEFRRRYPLLGVVVTECLTSDQHLRAMLLSETVEIGLGAVAVSESDIRLREEQVMRCPVALFVRDDHVLASRTEVDARVLGEVPCIQITPQALVWRAIHRELAAAGVSLQVSQSSILFSTAMGMLQAGMGAAMLPAVVREQAPPNIRCLRIRQPELAWPVFMIRRANAPLSPAAQAFATVVRDVLASTMHYTSSADAPQA